MNKVVIVVIAVFLVIGIGYTVHRVGSKSTTVVTEKVGAGTTSPDGQPLGKTEDPNQASNTSSKQGGTLSTAPAVTDSTAKTEGKATTVAGTASKPENNCYSFEYRHRKEAQNKDVEEFLDLTNAFPILHDKVATQSICVKVNGKPVAFKQSKYKNQNEVVVGSVVGPESVIKVSYCVGATPCKESCALKSNRFMDDMMSDAGDEDEFKESWGDSKEQKKELQAKVKEFRSVASENKDLQKQSVVRVWDTIQKNEWSCKK